MSVIFLVTSAFEKPFLLSMTISKWDFEKKMAQNIPRPPLPCRSLTHTTSLFKHPESLAFITINARLWKAVVNDSTSGIRTYYSVSADEFALLVNAFPLSTFLFPSAKDVDNWPSCGHWWSSTTGRGPGNRL